MNTRMNFEKTRKWTKGMAIYSTVVSVLMVMGLILNMLLGVETHIVSVISAGVIWPLFYGIMARKFYIFATELSQENIVSVTPYMIWIGAQVLNIVWLFVVNLLNFWEVWFFGPIVSGLTLSMIAFVPLRELKKNTK